MAARLVAAGFPQEDVQVLVPPGNAKKGNLVARLRGDGTQKPVLLRRASRRRRGAQGRLVGRSRSVQADRARRLLLRPRHLRRQGDGRDLRRQPDPLPAGRPEAEARHHPRAHRRTKRAATTTASRGWSTSIATLIDAEFGLNEGGGGRERDGKKLFNAVQATEKLYRDFDLEITNKGGHSSVPRPRQRDLSARRRRSIGSASSTSRSISTKSRMRSSSARLRSKAATSARR